MTEHEHVRQEYREDEIEDSPLTDADRDQLRETITTRLKQNPSFKERLGKEFETSVEGVTLRVERRGDAVDIDIHITEDAIDTEFTADEYVADDDGSRTSTGDPDVLRNLGETYESLEADLIAQMTRILDLPTYTPRLEVYVPFEFGFLCTSRLPSGEAYDSFATFSMSFYIPESALASAGDELTEAGI